MSTAAAITLSGDDRALLYEAVYDLLAREPGNAGRDLLRAASARLLIGRDMNEPERHAARLAAAAYAARTPNEVDARRLAELLGSCWEE